MCKEKHTFVYDSHLKLLHELKCCGALIDNKSDATIFVLEDNDIKTKFYLKHALNISLVDCALWNISTEQPHVNKKMLSIIYIY